ncbi:tetratricopeptide repeat protein [Chitinophaga polysaccharea]|uniref:Tetratricopeptide repeat protein n=1 Tax=Chitinophaga polysaccharea TaxID=1293035 RepID=A0A561Q344_9BACT|nr:tetratricopeptide repeat protein [Chitinophaga polysaccharea]TWF44782.1 tetratricopeptide repeat protein [Chitinophaga polysaccharea]
MLNYHQHIKPAFLAIALLFTFSVGRGQSAPSANPQHRFEEANLLFNQSKYTEAARAYQALLDEGHTQKALYFNAGNAWYKAGKPGLAVYNYEKALELSPNDAAVKHNLDLVNQKVNGFVEELPLVFFQQWWLQLQHLHKANGWAIGAVVLFWLLIAGIIMNVYTPGWRNHFVKWGTYVLGALCALYLLMAVDTYLSANNHQTGIVMNANIKAKTAPDENSRDAFEVGEGMKVHITDATADFCKIELADGKSGWISCSYIKRL